MPERRPVVFRLFNNLGIGGVTSRLHQVLPLLLDSFEVHMVTYRKQGELGPKFRKLGIQVHHVPLKGKWSPAGLNRLRKLFKAHQADIVHTHAFGGNVSGILAAAMAGVPVRLGQVHTRQQHWYGKTGLHRKKQQLEEYLIHSLFSDRVIFPSRAALDYFSAHCPVNPRKLVVLHNGIRPPEVLPASVAVQERKDLRERFGVPAQNRLIGFVGRITAGKGVEFAVDFMRSVQQVKAPYSLLMVGGTGSEEADREFGRQAGERSDGAVIYAGHQSDPYPFYRAFDGFFFPSESWTEAMPGTALEAAAHGLPILSRENPAMREISEYYTGVRFMDDEEDPVRSLERLFSHPPADTTTFLENFSIQAMAEKTRALYWNLLGQRRR